MTGSVESNNCWVIAHRGAPRRYPENTLAGFDQALRFGCDGIEYPLLIAGTADKAEASKAFPLIERVKSFPTTIFMDGNGSVHMVHSGFSGPATGEAYARLQALFESTIEELLGDE